MMKLHTGFSDRHIKEVEFTTNGVRTHLQTDIGRKEIYYVVRSGNYRKPEQYILDVVMYGKELMLRVKKTHLHLYIRKLYAYIIQQCTEEEFSHPNLSLHHDDYRKVEKVGRLKKAKTTTNQDTYELPVGADHYLFFVFQDGVKEAEKYDYFFKLLKECLVSGKTALSEEKYKAIRDVVETLEELHQLNSFKTCLYVASDCTALNEILHPYGAIFNKKEMLQVGYNDRVAKGLTTFIDVSYI